MTALDAAVVRRKLGRIRANLTTLAGIVVDMTPAAYASDEIRRRAIERLLQETIDAAVDTNNHLLRTAGRSPTDDYFRSFIELGSAGIIDPALAKAVAPAAGLRNRIIHEYEEIDNAQVFRAAQEAPEKLGGYLGAIEAYLTQLGL